MAINTNIDDKLRLLNGKDFWTTYECNELGIKQIVFADGPTGLRYQEGDNDHLGMNNSKKATCFPTSAAMSCTWNTELVEEVASCIATEAIREGVDVVLGPGINIKRNPLCGRNFEYYSEDPYLTKEMGIAFVNGLQKNGVGSSLKHFACNNQEAYRMSIDTIIDERALHEIYLKAFEGIIKESKPWTVMSAYNKLFGVHCSENRRLLTDILRDIWNYDGLVISDWYAVNDIVKSINNGLDLEMPSVGNLSFNLLNEAYTQGTLNKTAVDRAVNNILKLSKKCNNKIKTSIKKPDPAKHHEIARKAAVEAIVMLKNDNTTLPLVYDDKVLFVGELMNTPVIQGNGSSRVNPERVDSIAEELGKLGLGYSYEPSYKLNDNIVYEDLIKDVLKAVNDVNKVVIFAGLYDNENAESYDRKNLKLPDCQERLIDLLAITGKQIIVILQTGSVIEMPWVDKVSSVLQMHLSGQGAGKAIVDVITGQTSPSGKLTETYPKKLAHSPSFLFKGSSNEVIYGESIFTGYKYYDKKMMDVQFPFGFGLSYTKFDYSDLKAVVSGDQVDISFFIKNVGLYGAKEVAQIYIGLNENYTIQAVRKLAAFIKVFLLPGERKEISVNICIDEFKYYDTIQKEWLYATGLNKIEVGKSSRNIELTEIIEITQNNKKYPRISSNTTIGEIQNIPCLQDIINEQINQIASQLTIDSNEITNAKELETSMFYMPLRNIVQVTEGAFSINHLNGFIDYLNNILKETGNLYDV